MVLVVSSLGVAVQDGRSSNANGFTDELDVILRIVPLSCLGKLNYHIQRSSSDGGRLLSFTDTVIIEVAGSLLSSCHYIVVQA